MTENVLKRDSSTLYENETMVKIKCMDARGENIINKYN